MLNRDVPSRLREYVCSVAIIFLALAGSAAPGFLRDATAAPLFAAPYLSFSTVPGPREVAIGDLDGDGWPDLAVANDRGVVSVLLGNRAGTFGPATDYAAGSSSWSVAIAKLNGDGLPDLVVANQGSNTVSVLLGKGDGTFGAKTDYSTGNGPSSVVIGDLNGDGKPDLATANSNSSTVSVLLGNGDGTFGARADLNVTSNPQSVAIGDLNGDGKPDLAVVGAGLSVLLGNGNGTFQAPAAYPAGGSSVAIGDLNADGKPDVAVGSRLVSVLLGNGDGTLGPKVDYGPPGTASSAIAIGDLNGDGKLDLAVAYYGTTISVLLGHGDGTFGANTEFVAGLSAWSVAIGDLNGDGRPDLVVANEEGGYLWDEAPVGSVSVLLGNGNGTFGATNRYAVGNSAVFAAIGDLNGDGKPDLVACSDSASVLLGNGDGTFQARMKCPTSGGAVAIGDLDGDGKPDLAFLGNDSALVELGRGDGTFRSATSYAVDDGAFSMAIGDFNGDHRLDLVTANYGGGGAPYYAGTISVLLGRGDGTFGTKATFTTQRLANSMAVGDVNGDGNLDVIVANSNEAVGVLLGNGDGTFRPQVEYGAGDNPYGVAIGDLDGDGRPDLAVTNQPTQWGEPCTISVLHGYGDGAFGARTALGTWGTAHFVAIADLNGDGKLDLAAMIYSLDVIAVALGHGDGTFGPWCGYSLGGCPFGTAQAASVAIGDLNGDGKPDLVAVKDCCGTVLVLMNIGPGVTAVESGTSAAALLRLAAPRPNPSRGATEIRFVLPAASTVDLTVFDLAGRKVRSLMTGEPAAAGEHVIRWDGRDGSGGLVSSGVYTLRVRAGSEVAAKRLVVLR